MSLKFLNNKIILIVKNALCYIAVYMYTHTHTHTHTHINTHIYIYVYIYIYIPEALYHKSLPPAETVSCIGI